MNTVAITPTTESSALEAAFQRSGGTAGIRVVPQVRATARAAFSCSSALAASMFDDVYAEPHPLVDAERDAFTAYHASFVGGQH